MCGYNPVADSSKTSSDTTPVAIITGGGTGVGAATAAKLSARGYRIAVNYSRSASEAEATAAACREAIAIQGDVAADADCRRIVAETLARWGRVDALVNCAGATQFVPMDDLEALNAEDFQRVFAVNTIAPYQLARAAAPYLRSSGKGAIVHVSSTSAYTGNGSSYAYVTSKAALHTLTLALARALAPEIRVNCVVPGLITSRWLGKGLGEEAYQRVRQSWVDASALGKVCAPEDVAEVIAWLVADAALLTGQLITVDGGFLLGRPARIAK